MKKSVLRHAFFHPWQEEVKKTPTKPTTGEPEVLETTSRPFLCRYCQKHPDGHPSRLWEVWTVPAYTLRARVPECLLVKMLRKQKAAWKMSDPEKAICSELLRLGVLHPQECPK